MSYMLLAASIFYMFAVLLELSVTWHNFIVVVLLLLYTMSCILSALVVVFRPLINLILATLLMLLDLVVFQRLLRHHTTCRILLVLRLL